MSGRVAIIGGGISGLAAAWRLAQNGAVVTVFEASDRTGGVLRTDRIDGFLLEAGPESFLSIKPRGIGLARELGLEPAFQWTDPANRGACISHNGQLHPMPEGLTGMIPTRLSPMAKTRLVSPAGKARMLLDFVLPARKGDRDETLESFITRRLGGEVYRNLIEPLMAGIYSGRGDQLSLAATFPQLRAIERDHGGLIKGSLAARKQSKARTIAQQERQGFLSFQNGIQTLPDALVRALRDDGGEVRTSQPVSGLTRDNGGFSISTPRGEERFDRVVLAAPVHAQASLLAKVAPVAADAMRGIPQVSTAIVLLGFRESTTAKAPASYGYLVPPAEGRPVKAVTWMSRKWAGRAPDGAFLVRGFVGSARDQSVLQRSDDALIDAMRDELRFTSGITDAPILARVYRWQQASPQYVLGHLDRVERILRDVATLPGLEVAGNMLQGVGIPDAIASGEAAADRLTQTHGAWG